MFFLLSTELLDFSCLWEKEFVPKSNVPLGEVTFHCAVRSEEIEELCIE